MKLLEIKNNLVKLSYEETEIPVLGRFLVLNAGEKSYIAQFVNLKSDAISNFAIARLLFTFNPDGVVDYYEGSIPPVDAEVSLLASEELLNLLPIETAIKIGNLAQQEDMLNLDISVFERNFTVFADRDLDKITFISNCVRQLFRQKERSIIIDADNLFEDYPKVKIARDFKLPLNSKMIDYIFEYELAGVDAPTKAVIQDIFYAVQQYIKTLDYEFIPIDSFVDVVANQYKEMQMPELALLKNKLLKYRDANVFANSKEEVFALKEKLDQKNCTIIDIKDIHETLQKEVISFIHETLESFDKYSYLFVSLTDDNSDKRLLKQMINNNHVFTTFFARTSYKYTQELRHFAQNYVLFAPQSNNHDFGMFNTFINKLNVCECIVIGKLTQGIPFVVELLDLNLDLTRDDVMGERVQFVPVMQDYEFVKTDEYGNRIPISFDEESVVEQTDSQSLAPIPQIEQPPIELVEAPVPQPMQLEQSVPAQIQPVDNVLEEPDEFNPPNDEMAQFEDAEPEVSEPEIEHESYIEAPAVTSEVSIDEPAEFESSEQDNFEEEIITEVSDDVSIDEELTETDLDYIEDSQLPQDDIFEESVGMDELPIEEPVIDEESFENTSYVEEQPPVVPVYDAEEAEIPSGVTSYEFDQGDSVTHPRYGRGVVEKIIKYGNKTLCSISFENVGRRLLDPTISDLTKLG